MALEKNDDKINDLFGLSSLLPPTSEDIEEAPVPKKGADKIVNTIIEVKEPIKLQNEEGRVKLERSDSEKTYNARARFYDEDDKDFLKYYGGNLGFTQEKFLNFIIETELKNTKPFDAKDEDHECFRKNNLLFYTTARLPESLKADVLKAASNHRLTQEQYLGYLVRKARFETPGWY